MKTLLEVITRAEDKLVDGKPIRFNVLSRSLILITNELGYDVYRVPKKDLFLVVDENDNSADSIESCNEEELYDNILGKLSLLLENGVNKEAEDEINILRYGIRTIKKQGLRENGKSFLSVIL